MAFRIDIGSLRKPETLADGRRRVDAYLTRTGVFEYRDANGGIRREYRPATEVFKADSVASFTNATLTDDHPPSMVDASNWKNYAVGHLEGAPRQDGAHVAATIVVCDAATIAKLDGGKVQLSCGYECDLDPRPGQTPDGERYDAIQTNIRGNHVALVDVGRAGPSARVRMDAALTMIEGPSGRKDDTMTPEEMKAALEAATKRADDEKARADAAQAKLDAASSDEDDEDEETGKKVPAFLKKKMAKKDAQIEKLTADLLAATNSARDEKLRADKLEAARTDDAKNSLAAARARIDLEDKAKTVLGTEFKADASDRDLMIAVIKRVDGEDVDATASADFVRGLYAGASKRHDAGGEALAAVRLSVNSHRADEAAPDEEAAARKMREDSANAWKTKESK